MSIMKYTRKYVLYSLLALVVICGVGALVSSQIQKGGDEHGHDHADTFRPSDAQDKSVASGQSVWDKVKPRLKKKPKASHSHGHFHPGDPPPPREFPRDLQERLDKVRFAHGGHYTNEYYKSPGYFRDVYEAVSDGRDMETTIEILKEYGIYTDVVLEHMDNYEAFQYVLEAAHPDIRMPVATKYAERVFSEDPSSPEGLETGLYIARGEEHNFRRVLKYHPNSAVTLFYLGDLLLRERRPAEAIVYLKKASQQGQIGEMSLYTGDRLLSIAYQRLGDYKSAWVHLKKVESLAPPGHPWALGHLEAIAEGKPAILPIQRDPVLDATGQGVSVLQQPPVADISTANDDAFVDSFVVPEEVPASPQSPEGLSPEELARQDAEHQAFLEMLREQEDFTRRLAEEEQFREDYFREVEAFIEWAESIMNDAPIDTNNFLAKEMERHLRGKQTTFDPDRLKRGFDVIDKYGRDAGIKRLQQLDPDLAEQVTQQLNEKRVPPRHPRDKDK